MPSLVRAWSVVADILLMAAGGRRGDGGYTLPDPRLRADDRGLGTLTVDGDLRGYLASVVWHMVFASRQPWLWFVVAAWTTSPGWSPTLRLRSGQSSGWLTPTPEIPSPTSRAPR